MEALRQRNTLVNATRSVAFCYKGLHREVLPKNRACWIALCWLMALSTPCSMSFAASRNILDAFPQLQRNGTALYFHEPSTKAPSLPQKFADFSVALYLPVRATQRADLFPASGQRALQFRFNKQWHKSTFRQWASELVTKYHPPEQLVFWIQPFLQLLLAIDRDFTPEDTLTFVQIPNQQTQLFFNREWLFSSESPSHFDIMLTGVIGTEHQPSKMAKALLAGSKTTPKGTRHTNKQTQQLATVWSSRSVTSTGKANSAPSSPSTPSPVTLSQAPSNHSLVDTHSDKHQGMGAGPRPMLMMKYLKTLPKQAMRFTPNTRAYVTQNEG